MGCYIGIVPGHNDSDESNSIDSEEESYMNEIIRELLKHVNESGWEVTEEEIMRLWNLGYEEKDILVKGFIKKFQEIKDKSREINNKVKSYWRTEITWY